MADSARSSIERKGGRPTSAEAAALHQRLREAVVKTFLDKGYDATTMVAIAEAAGINKQVPAVMRSNFSAAPHTIPRSLNPAISSAS